MNKKILKIIGILIIIILFILVIPKVDALNDGGTKIYKALAYEITKVHKLRADSLNEFDEGTIIKVFGKEIYNDVPENVRIIDEYKDNIDEKNSDSEYEKNIDNITLNIKIPKDWKYEELPKNNENDFYEYALKIYKNQEDKYAVLYYYNQRFGVCGTGRTEKEMILNNGNKAIIGFYDNSDIWEDISFYETNKYIAILNHGLDKEESEQVLSFIKTININENKDKEEIELLVKEGTVSSLGATFILNNNTEETYTYGVDYEIETKSDNGWCKIEVDPTLSWNEVLCIIEPKVTQEINIDFSYGYGELSKGQQYRFVKRVFKEKDGPINESKVKNLYVEFEITN